MAAESAIRAMESLIRTSFGRATSPSSVMTTSQDCLQQSPRQSPTVSDRSRGRSDEETRSGGSGGPHSGDSSRPPSGGGGASRPPSAAVPPPETPRRAGTPPARPHVDESTPKRSPAGPLDADSSTFGTAACRNVAEEERRQKDLDAVERTSPPPKRRASSCDVEALPSTKRGRHSDEDERPTSTSGRLSALESLQGLVYRQTASSDHPLDSLQRLIYGGAGADVSVQLGHHQTSSSSAAAESDHQFVAGRSPVLAPQTLILVNPIVTVVSGQGGETAATPAPGGGGGGSAGESSGSSEDAGEQAVPPGPAAAPRLYRCRACRRKFSSKGSYRYHLGRCSHVAPPPRHKFGSEHAPTGATPTDTSGDVISAGSTFGGCAPLDDSGGRHLPAQYFAEAK